MRADQFRFTRDDIGCWIDGSRGNQGTVNKLAELMESLWVTHQDFEARKLSETAISLDPGSELAVFWAQDCTARLQDYTEDGLVWMWDAGDLVLTEDIDDLDKPKLMYNLSGGAW